MNLIDKLETRRDNIAKMYDNLLADVKDIIIKEGGYLNTANNDGESDNIYGAVLDFNGGGELVEVFIKAIKVENGNIYCYTAPITLNPIKYTDEDMKSDEGSWYELSNNSDLLYHYTLDNIADIIGYEEYVTEKTTKED